MTILQKMEDKSIFSIHKDGDVFVVQEECDKWFEITLTRAELRQLGQEIMSLADDTLIAP